MEIACICAWGLHMHRPAFWLAIAFSTGILLCHTFAMEYLMIAAAITSLACAIAGLKLSGERTAPAASLLAAVATGVFACAFYERSMGCNAIRRMCDDMASRVEVIADVRQQPQWEKFYGPRGAVCFHSAGLMELRAVHLPQGWVQARGRLRANLTSGNAIPLRRGDRVRLCGILRPIRRATNPGEFDRSAFWHTRGVDYSLSVNGDSAITLIQWGATGRCGRYIDALRARLRRGLEQGVPDCAERRIILAMILGYREQLEVELLRPFKLTNTMHILAISGLHVGFFYLAIRGLFRVVALPPRIAAAASIPLIGIYALVTGAATPVVRAAVMFCSFCAAPLLGRQSDTLNALGVAAIAILATLPLQLLDTGFQLSFMAVLAILLFSGRVAALFLAIWPCAPLPGQLLVSRVERLRWAIGRKIIELTSASVAAWIGLSVFIAHAFHLVTALGMVGNMVVIPAGCAIVTLGIAGALCSLFSTAVAGCINAVNRALVSLMLSAIRCIACIPWSWWHIPTQDRLFMGAFCGIIGGAASLLLWRRNMRGIAAALCATLIAALVPFALSSDRPLMRLTFLDVGQGDAIYCEFPGGENMLIDGGFSEGGDAGEMVLRPFLESLGRSAVDMVLLTHPHDDHLRGLRTVCDGFHVRRLILARWGEVPESYADFLGRAEARGIPVCHVRRGDRLARGDGVSITVLNPGRVHHRGTHSDLNNNSIVLLMRYGEVRILLCGDMEGEAEKELCGLGSVLRADLLKVGHHGGKGASTPEFLQMVSPRWAVISAGERNRFEHPSHETLARLRGAGVAVLRTDLHGAVTMTTDGRGMAIRTFR